MTDFPILRDLGWLLAAAAVVVLAARAVKVPAIVGYIVAGLLLGPLTGLVEATERVDLIAEVGIALLLFLVGLELSIDKIRDVGRAAVLAGTGQIVFTFVLGYVLAALLGFRGIEAALLALGLVFSSTVVVVKLLRRKGDLTAVYGRIAIGILLVQDVVVAIALTLLAGLGTGTVLELGSVAYGVVAAFGGMVVLIGIAFLATRYALPALFRWHADSLEAVFIVSLAWCFAFIVGAQALELSVEIGAFIAGVSLAQSSYNEELVRRVHPLVNFFLAVFFVSLGIHMEPGAIATHWWPALVLSASVLIGKPLILAALIPRVGYGRRTATLAATTLGQVSEFSFIVAALALGAGLIDEELLSLFGLIGLVTIGVSAVVVQYNRSVYDFLDASGVLRFLPRADREARKEPVERRDHIIVVGMNTLGRRLVHALAERGESVLAVDTDEAKLDGLPADTLQGNIEHHSVLEQAGLPRAKLLVSALRIEDANNLLAYRARRHGVPAAIHAFDPSVVDELRALGASYVMISKLDGIQQIADALRREGVIG